MLAKGTDEVLGKLIALVNIAADLADEALLSARFGLGLDVALVIGVGHAGGSGDHAGFGDRADEHSVRVSMPPCPSVSAGTASLRIGTPAALSMTTTTFWMATETAPASWMTACPTTTTIWAARFPLRPRPSAHPL